MSSVKWFCGFAIVSLLMTPVFACAPIVTSVPGGTVGVPYGPVSLLESGSNTFTWSVILGQLPYGLSLGSDGTISGTPLGAGTYTFTVEANDNSSEPPTEQLTIDVAAAPELTIATTSPLPSATVGASYVAQFAATGIAQGDTQTWTIVDGDPPPGLVLSASGALTGIPSTPGVFSFTVQLANQAIESSPVTVSKSFSLTIAAPPSFGITTDPTLPQATVGTEYTVQFATTGGRPPYIWAIGSGSLPPGLRLDATAGLVTGTPTDAGTYIFALSAIDATQKKSSGTFVLTVLANFAISTSSPLPPGATGASYSTTFSATGGTAPYTWSLLASAGSLPPGLTLDPASGSLTGIPTTSGGYTFAVVVTDAAGRTKSKRFILNVSTTLALVTTSPLTGAAVGAAYQAPLQASGGTPAYAWSVTTGALPDGLGLGATTGVISGTPTKAGTFNFQITVTDQSGGKVNGAFVIVVSAALTITTTSPLPQGATGSPYTTSLSAAGGTPPYVWSISTQGGAVPTGLTLAPSTGVLAGTPTTNGTYTFVAVATDSARRTATKQFTLVVGTKLSITTASP